MVKQKSDWTWFIMLLLVGVVIWGGKSGWFKFTVNIDNNQTGPTNLQPASSGPEYTNCAQLCSLYDYSDSYATSSTCKPGEALTKYGYPNQPSLLTCCCYNEAPATPDCIDSDGDDRDTVGHVTYAGETYTDKCLEVGQAVTEYICVNNRVTSKNWMCDYGEICMQTRSGGHCIPAPHVWHPGDVVFVGGGAGDITGGTLPIGANLNLADYGITTDGTCRLGVKLTIDWVYATGTPTCTGVQGMEGLKWDFYDSSGLEWTQIDTMPHPPVTYDLHPETHILQWDGVTPWRGTVSKTLGLPACNIHYNYQIEVYIYDC